MNRIYADSPALWSGDQHESGFAWIDANDADNNVFSFLRRGQPAGTAGSPAAGPEASPVSTSATGPARDQSLLACVVNFAAVPHHDYRVGLPHPGTWTELLNTDSESYSGSGVGNLGKVEATDEPWHGQPASATLSVPPLGALWLRYEGDR
jgi:1,4-alpha-glucan branching enzyme